MNLELSLAAARAQIVQVALLFALLFALDALAARHGSLRLRAALWAVLLFKLVLPPGLASPYCIAAWLAPEWTQLLQGQGTRAGAGDATLATAAAWPWIASWAIGCASCAALALTRALRARRAVRAGSRRSAPAATRALLRELALRLGHRGPLQLRVSTGLHGAALVGLRRPSIVVSADLLQPGSRAALEHVLLHEVAHLRRRDTWRALIWTAALCVYWFHPAVHAAARRAALLRELACDELAVRAARGGARAYERTLHELARPLIQGAAAVHARALGLSSFALGPSQIRARLEQLALGRGRPTRAASAGMWLLSATLCAGCVPMAVDAARPPKLDGVEGCMRVRYLVFAELAQQAGRRAPTSQPSTQETP